MENKNKNLEILIIEDNPRDLADAKTVFNKIKEIGSPVNFSYTSTLKEAKEMMQNNEYDGIISDMFFPYDNKKRDDNIEGWDYETSGICNKLVVSIYRLGFNPYLCY